MTDSLVGSVDQDSPSLGDQVNNGVDNNVVNVNELMYRAYGATLSVGPCDPTRLGDWQKRWDRISRFSRKQYDVPSGAVGRRYTEQLSLEVQHLTLSNFPADRVLVFSAVMLQRDRLVRKAVDIRRVLERRLKMWANEEFDTLMNESSRCDKSLHKPRGIRVDDNQHVAQVFSRLMLQGKVHAAVRWASEKGKSRVLKPTDCINGESVWSLLQSKHP